MEFEETASGRYLILSDKNQEFPTERLRVKSATVTKGASGKDYALLTLEGEDSGADYQMACYSRDVQRCVREWGKNPMQWQFCTFELKKGSARRELIPCENQNAVEEPIKA